MEKTLIDTPFAIPFTGAWKPSRLGPQMQDGDFRTLTNFRYTQKGIRSVKGMSKINSTTLVTPGSTPDNFRIETFETSPGYDWGGPGSGEGIWTEITGPGPADPDATVPVGETEWGSDCFYGSGNISEISYVFALTAEKVGSFSYGFDINGNYNTSYSYGTLFWKVGPTTYNYFLIDFYANAITAYFEGSTSIYTAAIGSGRHRIKAYVNLATGAWNLKIDTVEVASGTFGTTYPTGVAYSLNIATDNAVYFDNAWFVPGTDYTWAPA